MHKIICKNEDQKRCRFRQNADGARDEPLQAPATTHRRRARETSTLLPLVLLASGPCLATSGDSTPDLEREAQIEFVRVGQAVKERLAHEAAGDTLGAELAKRDAEAHRFRYLDLTRELERVARGAYSPLEPAHRNPFAPDASFATTPDSRPRRNAVAEAPASEHASWDLYQKPPNRDSATTSLSVTAASAAPGEPPRLIGMYAQPSPATRTGTQSPSPVLVAPTPVIATRDRPSLLSPARVSDSRGS